MAAELARVALVLLLVVGGLAVCVRYARQPDGSPALRALAVLGALLTGVPLVATALLVAWVVLLGEDDADESPFDLSGKLVGSSSFDDVDRCPFRFEELETVERCLGESHGFQDPSWWVAAVGAGRAPLRGERTSCRDLELPDYRDCRTLDLSERPEAPRMRIVASRSRAAGGGREVLVLEVAGYPQRQAVARALEQLGGG